MSADKVSDFIKISDLFLLNRMYDSSKSKMITAEISAFVSALSPEEHAKIRPVLERDLEFQRREKARIRNLKTTVLLAKSSSNNSDMGDKNMSGSSDSLGSQNSMTPSNGSSSVSPNSASKKMCKTCGNQLGFIFNSGGKCRKCQFLVCDPCRQFLDNDKKHWLCDGCFKERELLAASNEWFHQDDSASESISEVLLLQMRRATLHRLAESSSTMDGGARRPCNYNPRRNMSLPPIASENLLQVPERVDVQQREHPMSALHRFIQSNNGNSNFVHDSIEEDSENENTDTNSLNGSTGGQYLEVKTRYPFTRPRSPTR